MLKEKNKMQEENYERAEQERKKALASRDLGSYVNACHELGIETEPEISQDLEYGLNANEQTQLKEKLTKTDKKINTRRKYAALLSYHQEHNVDLGNPDYSRLRRGLTDVMGYQTLRTGRASLTTPVREAKKERVFEVYKRCIEQARKQQ